MSSESLKEKAIRGVFWKLLETLANQGIAFIISLFLARLLTPEDYGTIALIMVFISIANVFVNSGFGTALVQAKNVSDEDYSSVFFLSVLTSVVVYIILFALAPFIAKLYSKPILVSVLRILSLTIIVSALNCVQNAIISRNMEFEKLFYRGIAANIPSGIIGIICAYFGLGVWSLVIQQIMFSLLLCVIMWLAVKWRPKLVFKFSRIKALFSFGWKILASSLLNTLYSNIQTLIIGKMYTSSMLGFYNKGYHFPQFIGTNIDGAIQSVMLPTLSKVQDEKERAKTIMRRSITVSSFIIFPMMAGLAACANPFISLILTDKWLPCVFYLQVGCIVYALFPIHTANLQAINAMGRSDVFLKLEIIKKIKGVLVICITVPFGIKWIALGSVISSIISSFINSYPNKKLLSYSYIEQIKDILPNLIGTLIMFFSVLFIGEINLPTYLVLIIQVVSGVVIYLLYNVIIKSESLYYVLDSLKSYTKK